MMFVYNVSVRRADKVECDTFVRDKILTQEDVRDMSIKVQADVIVSLAGVFTPSELDESMKHTHLATYDPPKEEEVIYDD